MEDRGVRTDSNGSFLSCSGGEGSDLFAGTSESVNCNREHHITNCTNSVRAYICI